MIIKELDNTLGKLSSKERGREHLGTCMFLCVCVCV